jgi:bleomycin hydrolase
MNKNFKYIAFSFAILFSSATFAQDNLINSLTKNQSSQSKEAFNFTTVINLTNTSIKNQGSSGTCWSYATNSFLESEMIKNGKTPVDLSDIYSARCVYIEKGRNYVRMHGALTLGEGGATHDVINMYAKYGALPEEVYSGLNYGTNINKLGEMSAILKGVLDAVISNPNGKLTPNWLTAYTAVIDSYLGEVPEKFTYNGKTYTPKSFADEVVGINPEDYIELSSLKDQAPYKPFVMPVPDNWSFDQVYNVGLTDLTDIVDNALNKGYTIAWATDVSEKGFSWKNGIAYVPQRDYSLMSNKEKENLFNGPKPELTITEEMRQEAFDNYETTDDHGMHIIGLAKDQNGKEYYIVKNSWGLSNDYNGYLYVTKAFVQYKTTSIFLNKKGLPQNIKQKLKI